MNILKYKSIALGLLRIFALVITITSCQQDELDTLTTENLSETQLRNCIPQAPNTNDVVNFLNGIIGEVQKRNAGNPSNIPGFYDSYANYLESRLCLQQDVNWANSQCSGGSSSCPAYTIGALQRLKCDLKAFNSNPSCGNARSLQIRFVDYIKTLNICFNTNLNEDGYADALRLPPCTGYYY